MIHSWFTSLKKEGQYRALILGKSGCFSENSVVWEILMLSLKFYLVWLQVLSNIYYALHLSYYLQITLVGWNYYHTEYVSKSIIYMALNYIYFEYQTD